MHVLVGELFNSMFLQSMCQLQYSSAQPQVYKRVRGTREYKRVIYECSRFTRVYSQLHTRVRKVLIILRVVVKSRVRVSCECSENACASKINN